MQTIYGKFNTAKIFTDVIDERSVEQIQTMCDSEVFRDCRIRIMPDVHAGAGCTIGTTMTVVDRVVPNMVGVDIGCGMELARLQEKEIDLAELDRLIYRRIPSGLARRETPHPYAKAVDLSGLRCGRYVNLSLAECSVGTLGGGNHFIEADVDEQGNLYLVVHSGSRHLGLEVAEYYQQQGFRKLSGNSAAQLQQLIADLKAAGRAREIEAAVKAAKAQTAAIDPAMAYVDGQLFKDYIHDMKLVQDFAVHNRRAMIDEIVDGLGVHIADSFTTIHNYIDTERMILRKGAVSAQKGERLLIPINMRDGSLICVGKGNEDWNCSAPHGAGRVLSRGKARAQLTVEEFEKEMAGIYSTSINENTLDESPMAYKKLEDIIDNIEPTAEIVTRIRPVYNFKASETVTFGKKKNAQA